VHFAFLGTSGAVPSLSRDTTSLVFAGAGDLVLVDCGGSPVQKLLLAGLDPRDLSLVVITHLHPDHAYGLPALVQNLILLGRRAPLPIACRQEHAEPLQALLALFGVLERPGQFAVRWVPVHPRVGVPVGTTASFALTAGPASHGRMPNMAVRVERRDGQGGPVVYSSDTEPCDDVVALAAGAHTLIHEATYLDRAAPRAGVHCTAAEAGEVASRAGVRRLILTHLDAAHHDEVEAMARVARERFGGLVEVAEELVPYPL
jgi:ribonuclease Z